MNRNRFSFTMTTPIPHPPAVPANAFVAVPLAAWPAHPLLWQAQQAIYQMAREEALAVVRPSIVERDLAGRWN